MAWTGIIHRAYGALGVFNTAFGIAGWEGDAEIWSGWAEMNPELAGVLVGAGGMMVLHWIVWEVSNFRKRVKTLEGEQVTTPPVQNSPTFTNVINVGDQGEKFDAGAVARDILRQVKEAHTEERVAAIVHAFQPGGYEYEAIEKGLTKIS